VLDAAKPRIFQGKIIVEPHAQKTDGKMMTRALLLSDEAEADNKPELEISPTTSFAVTAPPPAQLDEGLRASI